MNHQLPANSPASHSLSPTWLAIGAGAGGGLLSFFVGEIVAAFARAGQGAGQGMGSWGELLFGSALWLGAIGLVIGAAILIDDNARSLRGQWHRDVLRALPLFFALSFLGGAAGQLAYFTVQNPLTRGIGWSLMGAGIGVGIGTLRRDSKQALRGALGGGLGGFAGGLAFDFLAGIWRGGDGSFSRLVGQILMGALIALLMRAVQEALKDAVLLGVSTGPYEGKEYPLNTARVSVGRAGDNDISLFREEIGAPHLGALISQNNQWHWQGEAVEINGTAQQSALLNSGDTLQLGATRFRFYTRSKPDTAPVVIAQVPATTPAATPKTTGAPRPKVPLELPALSLIATDGKRFAISTTMATKVGRAAQNEIVLSEAGVSSHHATLGWSEGKLWLCDLNSTNGTFLNDAKIAPQTPTPVQSGDRVRFGNVQTSLSKLQF